MNRIIKKHNPHRIRKITRIAGLCLFLFGLGMTIYFAFPFLSFQLYIQPAFASQGITAPIPKSTMLNNSSLRDLIHSTTDALTGVDYTNAQNWYPSFQKTQTNAAVTHYLLSIPKLEITDAYVSTVDNDLSSHLVHYGGTAVPPGKGNAVIFGHSTLPQLYNAKDYKTIFANLHTLQVGDMLILTVEGLTYNYRINSILITTPSDTSFFEQNFDDNYLTLVTCTPPGTTWKRLVIKAKIEKVN